MTEEQSKRICRAIDMIANRREAGRKESDPVTARDHIHPLCTGCGADLTEEGSLSFDYPDTEWGELTGHVEPDGRVLPEFLVVSEKDLDVPLSCASCGKIPAEE